MDPKKALDTLQKLGAGISSKTMVVLLVVLPLALGVVGLLWKKRAALTKFLSAPKRLSTDSQAPLPSVSGNQLRATWLRFLQTLPRVYRRSILSFDHFVVLGDAAAGKSLVIDRYTDFRRQAKQFLGSHVFDSYIDLYIGSRSVTMELAASVLFDVGPKCRGALRRLWRPLYRRSAPTVVVVVDMERLKRDDYDLVDYAERLRGKINLLSEICKRPLEVRVVLTHLDQNPGFEAFSELCSEEKIPLYMPARFGPDAPPLTAQLEAWLEGSRAQLSRALLHGGASRLRACVTFLRATASFPRPLAKFVEVLFAPETFSLSPRSGGIYLSSALAAEPNPLQGRPHGQRPPDPRARHRVLATAMAALVLAYLSTAFFTQRSTRLLASTALASYVPATPEHERDRALREAIEEFACEGCGAVARVPDFYRDARVDLRAQFSDRVRSGLLIPNLRKVARDGFVVAGSLASRARRTLFYLALIHADRSDSLRIAKDQARLQVWAEMTELPPALITMYLEATDRAFPGEVAFELPDQYNPHDMAPYWLSLLNDLERVLGEGHASADQLKALQARAADAAEALKRYEHDDIVEEILGVVLSSDAREPLASHTRYKLQFEMFGSARKDVDLSSGNENSASLGVITQTIRASYVAAPEVPLVATLAERLASLYELPVGGAATQAQTVRIADKTFTFHPAQWAGLVRNVQASALVAALLRHPDREGSIFIAEGAPSGFSALRWNATNDGSAIFTGRAEIAPAYTRAAYDALVREPVQALERVLQGASIPGSQKEQLAEFVRRNVRSYAVEYERQLRAFYAAFELRAPSAEALRVAVAQMAVDESQYGAFLHSVHRQLDIDTSGELLIGMQQELREYAGLRQLFDHSGAEAEIGKYRAILAQLLQDLGKPGDVSASDTDQLTDPAHETLERALNQAGRVALQSVRRDSGSYAQLILQWHASLGLSPVLIQPFLSPIFELERVGLHDAQRVLSRAWEEQIAPDLQRISRKFPFETRDYSGDVTPQELDGLLNPTTGRLFSFVRRYLSSLSDPRVQGHYQLREVFRERLKLPDGMVQTIQAGEQLASQLYDAKGRAAPLTLQIATVPFEHGTDPQYGLTLVYLSVGEASIHNFNQRPGLTTVRVDWTREQISQVGIQLMNLDTQEKLYPEPLATPASSWSALHLLAVAKATPVKKPENAQLYTWQVRHQPGGGRTTAARFIVLGDPFALFTLGGTTTKLAYGGAP